MKKNLLLFFGAVLLALVLGEIICRIKGDYLSYNERAGAGGYISPFEIDARDSTRVYLPFEKRFTRRNEFTDSFTANQDGLKEKNITPIKSNTRLLILGDSYAEGVGAPPDSSYPRLLERLLLHTGDSTEVIDAGIGGSDLFFEFKLLQALLPKYKPDVVLVTCNSSDVFDCAIRGGFERFNSDGSLQYNQAPWFEPLYALSMLVRLLVHDLFHYDFSLIQKQCYETKMRHAELQLCLAIDSFQTFCRFNRLSFAMVFHPFYKDIEQPELYNMQTLINHCRQKEITYTDELDYLRRNGITNENWETIYWPEDGHFKPKGYVMMAQCVCDDILPSLKIQCGYKPIK